jgi:hypothetical protein
MDDTTYRLIDLVDTDNTGRAASSPELAKLVPGDLRRGGQRLGIEQTDWKDEFGKKQPYRSVIVDAEGSPNDWTIGA